MRGKSGDFFVNGAMVRKKRNFRCKTLHVHKRRLHHFRNTRVESTTIVVDESEWEMADRQAAATIFTAQSITGMPKVHREEGESRRFVVTNTGKAIVVERSSPPGLMIIIQ